jgi:hypothetical protein
MTTPYQSPMNWIKLAKYCEDTGDTSDAVHARRRKRQWKDGTHCQVGPDGNLWINPEAVNRWIAGEPQGDTSNFAERTAA